MCVDGVFDVFVNRQQVDDDYSALQERLGTLPDKLSYNIMVGHVSSPRPWFLVEMLPVGRNSVPVPPVCPFTGHHAQGPRQRQQPQSASVSLHRHTTVIATGALTSFPFPQTHMTWSHYGDTRGVNVSTKRDTFGMQVYCVRKP